MMKTSTWTAFSIAGILIVAAALPLPAAGQQAAPAPPSVPVPPPVPATPARRPFVPPSDGRLTADQVKMYIAVRRLAATLVKPADGGSDPIAQINRLVANLNNEASAASQLGADIDEYRWVSVQVIQSEERPAGAALPVGEELLKAIATAAAKARESFGATAGQPALPAAEASAAAAETLAYNRQLLNRHKAELDALKPR